MENQVETADFVLMVCTETYLRRYRGQEVKGGQGVTFEGVVVISQNLYDSYGGYWKGLKNTIGGAMPAPPQSP